jgi:uncharacterized membrane protein
VKDEKVKNTWNNQWRYKMTSFATMNALTALYNTLDYMIPVTVGGLIVVLLLLILSMKIHVMHKKRKEQNKKKNKPRKIKRRHKNRRAEETITKEGEG